MTRHRPHQLVLLHAGVLAAFAACTSDGADDDVVPAAPALPAPPVLTPCPEGWRVAEATRPGDPPSCTPWPTSEVSCSAGQARFPDGQSCVDVGVACPPGDWPADLPDDRAIVYVKPASEPGGTGTNAAPLATIAEATATATPGTIIALAKGVYSEQVRLPAGVELWGACSAAVAIASDGIAGSGIVEVVGPSVVIRNLRVGPGVRAGIVIDGAGRSATIAGVIVERATLAGIVVAHEATATARDLRVQSTQGDVGYGVLVTTGGSATITRASIYDVRGTGIFARGQAGDVQLPSVQLSQVAVDRVFADALNKPGAGGIAALHGGVLTADAVAVRGAVDGIVISHGARGTVRDARLTEVYAGIVVDQATLHAERVFTYANSATLASIQSTVSISDVIATSVAGGSVASTLACGDGGTLDVQRVVTAMAALSVSTGCTATVSDLVGRGGIETGGNGQGHVVAHDAMLTIDRLLLEDSPLDGLRAQTGGTIVARDVTVRDLRGTKLGPVGLVAGLAARLDVERARVERVSGVGVGAIASSSLHASELYVGAILDRDCGDGSRCDGYSVASVLDSDLDLYRFRLESAAVAGVIVSPRSRLELDAGVIAGHPVGINLQAAELDRDQFRAVRFRDNGVDLDRSSLPIPSR